MTGIIGAMEAEVQSLCDSLEGILSRAALTEGEAKYLEKTFNKISGLAKKNNK